MRSGRKYERGGGMTMTCSELRHGQPRLRRPGPWDPGPLPPGLLERLQHDALAEGAELALVNQAIAYNKLADIVGAVGRRQDRDPVAWEEMRRWSRSAARAHLACRAAIAVITATRSARTSALTRPAASRGTRSVQAAGRRTRPSRPPSQSSSSPRGLRCCASTRSRSPDNR